MTGEVLKWKGLKLQGILYIVSAEGILVKQL